MLANEDRQEMESWNEAVWNLVSMIPQGKVATYGQIAAILGFPRRARHVGYALKQSPEGRQLPWQRVINGKGQISFSFHSEQFMIQRAILEKEGVAVSELGKINLKTYGWRP